MGEYVITFADVMAALITIGMGLLGWFLKNWIADMKAESKVTRDGIKQIDEKFNKRMAELEDETRREQHRLEEQINEFKSDFATTFVLREDYFRAMNKVEDSIKGLDNKLDKLLMRSEK